MENRRPALAPRRITVSGKRESRFANWQRIVQYLLKECQDIQKSICVGCGTAILLDKNNTRYRVRGSQTLDEVKKIMEEIRVVNANR